MHSNPTATAFPALVRREWTRFKTPHRLIRIAAAALFIVLAGLLPSYGNRASCSQGAVDVACPTDPVGPDGRAVSDTFYFVHQPLGENGSITVRMTSISGIITYPPPDHDEIVSGLVPWAKAGIIVKDSLEQGSSYAALMVTGSHGTRMQHDYVHDTAGSTGGVTAESPRWLRLTRAGDTITGYESPDGQRWTEVAEAHFAGLSATVQVGLFTTSPGDLTLKRIALGGSIEEVRFTQATAVFDNVSLDSDVPPGEWSADSVGEMGNTDWERLHQPPGLVEAAGTFTVTGSGDIGPVGTEGGRAVEDTLTGLAIGMMALIVIAARFTTATTERRTIAMVASPLPGRVLAARALVVGGVSFVAGLVATAVVVEVGTRLLRANGASVLALSALTELRVVVGAASLLAVAAVFALAVAALVRRTWLAVLVAISAVVLPYVVATLPLLPDSVSNWLLRLTPASGFAVQQTVHAYPQVVAHYAPSAGYFPLPWWAGFTVLCAYTAALLALLALSRRHSPDRPCVGGRPKDRRTEGSGRVSLYP